MRTLLYRSLMATTLICQALAFTCFLGAEASAQTAPSRPPMASPASPSGPASDTDEATSEQMALSEKQIEAFIAAQPVIDVIVKKIPQDQLDNPNPQVQASLDRAAKKFGFKDYGDFEDVGSNISFILQGFDEEKKVYVGQEVVLRAQMAELAADKSISPRERADQMKELKQALKEVEPVKFPANIALVTKYYDKLAELLGEDD